MTPPILAHRGAGRTPYERTSERVAGRKNGTQNDSRLVRGHVLWVVEGGCDGPLWPRAREMRCPAPTYGGSVASGVGWIASGAACTCPVAHLYRWGPLPTNWDVCAETVGMLPSRRARVGSL
eukprot:527053-Prymnesium_polylepis.1